MSETTERPTAVETVQRYVQLGFRPIPIRFKTKEPLVAHWPELKVEPSDIESVFGGRQINIGIVLGAASGGLVDVDIDDPEALRFAPIFLPSTGMIFGRASRPRSHWVYQAADAGRRRSYDDRFEGSIVEVRGTGHQTVFPGSVHESDELVRFDEDGVPAVTDWETLVRAARKIAIATMLRKDWTSGHRHRTALAVSGVLANANWTKDEVRQLIETVAIDASDTEVNDRLTCVETTFEQFMRGNNVSGHASLEAEVGPAAQTIAKWCRLDSGDDRATDNSSGDQNAMTIEAIATDAAAATTFAQQWKDDVIFCEDTEQWFKRDKKVYDPISAIRMQGLGLEFVIQTSKLVGRTDLRGLQSCGRINNIIQLTRAQLRVELARLNAHKDLLGCKDGTLLDLQLGAMLKAATPAIITKRLGVSIDPAAQCHKWLLFLKRILRDDLAMIKFLQRAIGYSLTGSVDEQCLFLLIGKGANGKTTLLNVLHALFGDYAGTVPMQTLMVSRSGGDTMSDLAMLPGMRFVTASEGEPSQKLAEAKIKLMTGGDPITCRPLYKNFFTYQPQFKLWVATNNLPTITGTDEGIWRRIRVLPFDVTIPREERDPQLGDKLKLELPGILNWALDGHSQWRSEHLNPPAQVIDATRAYRLDNDTLAQFIEACCLRAPAAKTPVKALYDRYTSWCADSGFDALSKIVFGRSLGQKGFVNLKERNSNAWGGLHLKDQDQPGATTLFD